LDFGGPGGGLGEVGAETGGDAGAAAEGGGDGEQSAMGCGDAFADGESEAGAFDVVDAHNAGVEGEGFAEAVKYLRGDAFAGVVDFDMNPGFIGDQVGRDTDDDVAVGGVFTCVAEKIDDKASDGVEVAEHGGVGGDVEGELNSVGVDEGADCIDGFAADDFQVEMRPSPGGLTAVEAGGFEQVVDGFGHVDCFGVELAKQFFAFGAGAGGIGEEEFGDGAHACEGRAEFVADNAENAFHGADGIAMRGEFLVASGGFSAFAFGDFDADDANAGDFISTDADGVVAFQPISEFAGARGSFAVDFNVDDRFAGENAMKEGLDLGPEVWDDFGDSAAEVSGGGQVVHRGEGFIDSCEAELAIDEGKANRSTGLKGVEESQCLFGGALEFVSSLLGLPALDGDAGEMGGVFDQVEFLGGGLMALAGIHRKGADDLVGAGPDRLRPAGS